MKSNVLKATLVALTILISGLSAYAESPFASLVNRNDVEVTYVSKYLVNSKRHALFKGGVNFSSLLPTIESIYVIEATSSSGKVACKQAMKDFLKGNNRCQMLMTSRDGSDYDAIYGVPIQGTNNTTTPKYEKIVIYSEDSNEINLVIVNEEGPKAQ